LQLILPQKKNSKPWRNTRCSLVPWLPKLWDDARCATGLGHTVRKMTEENQTSEDIALKYNLDAVDKQIIRLMIANPEISLTEIGKVIGMTPQGVGVRTARVVFKKAWSEQLMTAPELFKKAQELAIRKLIAFIQGPNEKLAFEASKIFAFPLMQAQAAALTPVVEETITFRTRIGPTGEVIRQRSIDGRESREDVIEIEGE
jgi:hypothetical protein